MTFSPVIEDTSAKRQPVVSGIRQHLAALAVLFCPSRSFSIFDLSLFLLVELIPDYNYYQVRRSESSTIC